MWFIFDLSKTTAQICYKLCVDKWFACPTRMVGHGFMSWPGHTKDRHRNGTNCLPAWHRMH